MKLFFKKFWDWGYYVMLVWILTDRSQMPTVRETIVLTLFTIVVLFLILGFFWNTIPPEKRWRSTWWIPLAYGLGFYTLPRLIHLVFHGPMPRLWNDIIMSVLGIWVIVSVVQLIRMRKTEDH
jgi:hypothetical protein